MPNALVKEGLAAAHRFRLLAGYVGWDAGQLSAELLSGRWWALAASPPLVISCLHGRARSPHAAPLISGAADSSSHAAAARPWPLPETH